MDDVFQRPRAERQSGDAAFERRPVTGSRAGVDGGGTADADIRAERPAEAKPVGPAAPVSDSGAASAVQAKQAKTSRRPLVLAVVGLVVLGGGGTFGYRWWTDGRFMESTDDAYVGADTTILAAKVSGYVTSVAVEANAHVAAGAVIARIDDGDYANKVAAAENKVALQRATIARIGEQIGAAGASVRQAQAQVAAARADLDRANATFERKQQLLQTNNASQQTIDDARADRDRAVAALASADAAVVAAQANVRVLAAQQAEAEVSLKDAQTSLEQAQRDLSFTVVRAPVEGVVGNRAVQVGQFVQPGTRLAAIVPLDGVYVDANFKETQLRRLKPGQHVEVDVDAYPSRHFSGTVTSVSPASGSVFSLLPPENATGNFTKIVQRVPVRIRLEGEALAENLLRPGMSVTAIVDTRGGGTAAKAARAE